jgi:cobalamin biosynthesis Mg chelatase CobN
VFIQCIFESGQESSTKDLRLLERVLTCANSLPFDLVVSWINLRITLHDYEYVKPLVEDIMHTLEECAKTCVTPSVKTTSQYVRLVCLYVEQILPQLGEIEAAQHFLTMHSNNSLLPKETYEQLSCMLDKQISKHMKASSTNGDSAGESIPSPSSAKSGASEATVESSQLVRRGQSGTAKSGNLYTSSKSSTRKGKMKERRDAALVITKKQANYAIIGLILLIVLNSQRSKLARLSSAIINAIFSGT